MTSSAKRRSYPEEKMKRMTVTLSGLVILMALGVLAGWFTGNPYLKSVVPGLIAMNPLTASCFILLGAAVILSQSAPSPQKARIQAALALIVALAGAAKVAFYTTGVDIPLDRILFADRLEGNAMAPNTAIAFTMSGFALLALSWGRTVPLGQVLSFGVVLFAWMALLGYAYSSVSFYKLSSYIPMALHTATAFVLMGVSMVCSRRTHFASILASSSGGSQMAKRLLPASFFIPSFFGAMRILGEKEGFYTTNFGVTLHAMCNIIVFFFLIALSARSIHKLHLAQLRKEDLLNTQYVIGRILSESPDLHAAMKGILARFGGLGWQAGTFWALPAEGGPLQNRLTWHADDRFRPFCEASAKLSAEDARALPARVRSVREVVWIKDLAAEKEFLRTKEASAAGLRSAFGLPILVDGEALGVIELFSVETRPFDEELVKVAQAIGLQIGSFIKRKQGEEELRKARDEALQASHAKSEFLAVMSHEIRTPMNAIVGMADLLSESGLSREQLEYVKILQRAGDTLLTLINDILDLSKVEAGHTELEEAPFDLRDFVERTMEFMAVRAHQKGIELGCRVSADLPSRLTGDSNRLRQILVNLVGNAIKFTEKGEVVVEVRKAYQEAAAGSKIRIHFSVRDTGVGIPRDKQELIFQPFVQADSSTTRKFGGTGLGLSICKKLVSLMNGSIEVESAEGCGSTFSFDAELGIHEGGEVPKETGSARGPGTLEGIRVLVVDDNSTNRLIIREMLAAEGMKVSEAEGGADALRELERCTARKEPFDLLLLDCRMPMMDGFTLAEKIKANAAYDAMMVMMLTSDHRNGDVARANELGLESYLIKPIKKGQLLATIEKIIGRRRALPERTPEVHVQPQQALPAAEPAPTSGLRVLLVDDSEDNRTLILAYLKKTAHKVDTAENGRIAFEKVTGGAARYDIVFMDVHMPVMDGYAATRAIRDWEKAQGIPPGKGVPIIALTANALKEDAKKSEEAGCNGHLTKPIKKAELLAAIEGPEKLAA